VIEVLSLSDREVRDKLNARLLRPRPLILSQTRGDRFMRPVPEREPFATLEHRFGDQVDQLVVVDEGSVEGMWRDPLGELADRLYPDDRVQAYAAASGYLLLRQGRPLGIVKKHGAAADAWFLQEALHRAGLRVPTPSPDERPGRKPPPTAAPGARRSQVAPETEAPPRSRPGPSSRRASGRSGERVEHRPPPSPPPAAAEKSPWEILGIAEGSSRDEAKKAFRTQIALYHPDKVAHLAPEFQRLAEDRTRALLAAWETLDRDG
jgi:DnaJ-domain-containing protein 1